MRQYCFFLLSLIIKCLKYFQVNQNRSLRWTELIAHWPLWALYIAHFAMNWSNYIIMQWLPTYLTKNLSASANSISLTALPYIVNSLVGIGKLFYLFK